MDGPNHKRAVGASHALNPALVGFACITCGLELGVGDYPEGCSACLARGEPSSVTPQLRLERTALSDPSGRGMSRYAHRMPYLSWVTLGEGGTPCVPFPGLAAEVGAGAVFIKNEGQNPSGSHKDRASCLTVTRALDRGAAGIVAASSGNAGASIALYAAAAGMDCCIVSTPTLSPVHRRAIELTGARLVTAPESLDRWKIVARMVREQGWFPATNYLNPPVGSNPFGVSGLKTIAFELFEELGPDIDAILVPTSRGDLIWGLYEGFCELHGANLLTSLPRLIAVEPFPRIARTLAGEPISGSFPGTTALVSIGGSTVTRQAVTAIERTDGEAVAVDSRDAASDQRRLARHGCFVELSSASALTALRHLAGDATISSTDTVVLVATSNGYKDMPGTALPE